MLVALDSPLRNLSVALADEQVLFLNGTRYSIEMVEVGYERLCGDLLTLSDADKREEDPRWWPVTFADAWAMVDAANRLRELMEDLPQLKKKSPWATALRKALAELKDVRNVVQHLDTHIRNTLVPGRMPVWGWLSWTLFTEDGFALCWALAGSLEPRDWTGPHIALGAEVAAPIDRIMLHAYGHDLSLTEVYRTVERFVPRIEQSIKDAIDEAGAEDADTRPTDLIACAEFR